jgi:hypothetical protein
VDVVQVEDDAAAGGRAELVEKVRFIELLIDDIEVIDIVLEQEWHRDPPLYLPNALDDHCQRLPVQYHRQRQIGIQLAAMLGEVKGQMIAVPRKVEPVIPPGHLLDVLEVEAVRTADREANAVRNDGHAIGDGAEKRRAARIRDVAWLRPRSHVVPEDVGDNLHEGKCIPIRVDEWLQLRLVRQADTELRDRSRY